MAVVVTDSPEISNTHFVSTHLQAPSLERLRIIEVDNLQVTSLFSMSMARSMVQLRVLKISKCNNLVQIISIDKDRGKEVESTGHEESVSWFPHLQELVVTECEMISSFLFPAFMARGLAQLQELKVSKLPKLKHVFGDHKGEGDWHGRDFYLPRLDKVKLEELPNLISLWQGESLSSSWLSKDWNSLFSQCQPMQDLEVSGCPNFSTYFVANMQSQLQAQAGKQPSTSIGRNNLQGGKFIMQLQGEEVNLLGLSLRDEADIERIWSGFSLDMRFSSLKWVTVTDCCRLKQVFTTAIVKSLVQMECLTIMRCNELENVTSGDAVDDVKEEGHLKSLRFLKIIQCEKLKTIFSRPVASHCLPKLEELHLESNSELTGIFGDEMVDAKNQMAGHLKLLRILKVVQCEKLKTIFSLCDSHLPNLEELHLKSNPELRGIFNHRIEDATNQGSVKDQAAPTTLKVLVVSGCPQISSQFLSQLNNQLQAPAKLRTISLEKIKGEVEEVIQLQQKKGDESLTYDLFWLNLYDLQELKFVWNGTAKNVYFSYLNAVVVKHCNKLKHLFTTTIARSMLKLRFLTIEQCSNLEHVVGGEDDNVVSSSDVTVLFPELEWLRLKNLPKLVSFCPLEYQLKPHFKKHWLKVEKCPKNIEDFFSGQPSPKVEENAEIQEASPV